MADLPVLVDFDNIDLLHRGQGPVSLAKMLVSLLPANLLHRYDTARVRLYGGWRSITGHTPAASSLYADIEANSPTPYTVQHMGQSKTIRIIVTLAHGPAGTRKIFPETLAKNRPLRHFRSVTTPWRDCGDHAACGFSVVKDGHNSTPCGIGKCTVRLGDILVRDEQKMVDTLMVADIAHETFVTKSNDIVVVSSDADLWPGIYMALNQGRFVTQIHPKSGWKTSTSLLATLDHAAEQGYRQFST